MKKCENTYIAQQCISMKATIQNFKLGLKMASMMMMESPTKTKKR